MTILARVKVCGLTRRQDVDVAVAAGVDALGFVHYAPSPRHVEADRVPSLVRGLPPSILTVGVLVDASRAFAEAWIAATGLGAVQLCGDESPEEFAGFDRPVLRRVPVDPRGAREIERWRDVADLFVLDHPASPGGTGLGVDPALARDLAASAPCMLAGGLDPDTVAERVAEVRPLAVDASSRLEIRPGVKCPSALRAFADTARKALDALPDRTCVPAQTSEPPENPGPGRST